MKTTESILADLARQRAESVAGGDAVQVQQIDQQVIAHQTLARLRADRARYADADDTATAAAVDMQIGHWRRLVDEDVEPAIADVQATTERPLAEAPARPRQKP